MMALPNPPLPENLMDAMRNEAHRSGEARLECLRAYRSNFSQVHFQLAGRSVPTHEALAYLTDLYSSTMRRYQVTSARPGDPALVGSRAAGRIARVLS